MYKGETPLRSMPRADRILSQIGKAGVAEPDVRAQSFLRVGAGLTRFTAEHLSTVLMIGSEAITDSILSVMRDELRRSHHHAEIVPFRTYRATPSAMMEVWRRHASTIEKDRIQRVVVALDDHPDQLPVEFLLSLRAQGIGITDAASFYEEISGRIPVEFIRPIELIFSHGFVRSKYGKWIKRWMDGVFALVGLIIALPLFLVLPLLIKGSSKGPVFYFQERVGWKGRRFNIIKFRTMIDGAEQDSGPIYAEGDDPRVTRVGRFLRRTRLDELPQLINILIGEMSFVGPRPERPCFVEQLSEEIPYYKLRSTVKPGLTGWAQILSHYAATPHENLDKFGYDLYYIKHMSILFDLAIIWDTFRVVLTGFGAR